jgi:DHA2 family multidrug resistance protein
VHRSALVNHLDKNNFTVQQKVLAMQHGFMAKGIPSNTALKDTYQSLEYVVMKQASVLSYMDVFLWLGVMFLICIPFVLMVKGNKKQKIDLAEAMH